MFENKLRELEAKLHDKESTIKTLEADRERLEKKIESLEARIWELEKQLDMSVKASRENGLTSEDEWKKLIEQLS